MVKKKVTHISVPSHWEEIHRLHPFNRLHPNQLHYKDEEETLEWHSRRHRKGRRVIVRDKEGNRIVEEKFFYTSLAEHNYWSWDFGDISWWVAQFFLWGSVAWVINGFGVWLEPFAETKRGERISQITALVGGTLFEIGAFCAYLEALNIHPAAQRPKKKTPPPSPSPSSTALSPSSPAPPPQSASPPPPDMGQSPPIIVDIEETPHEEKKEEEKKEEIAEERVEEKIEPPPSPSLPPPREPSPPPPRPSTPPRKKKKGSSSASGGGSDGDSVSDSYSPPSSYHPPSAPSRSSSSSSLSSISSSYSQPSSYGEEEQIEPPSSIPLAPLSPPPIAPSPLPTPIPTPASHKKKKEKRKKKQREKREKRKGEFKVWGARWREIGYVASFIQLCAATIFWISTITGMPNVIDMDNVAQVQGLYWTPQVVGGCGFIVASLLFMYEVQPNWYHIKPGNIGWEVGFWNLVGAVGFTLCGIFGYYNFADKYQRWGTAFSTFWGGWAFLLGSYIQLIEAINK